MTRASEKEPAREIRRQRLGKTPQNKRKLSKGDKAIEWIERNCYIPEGSQLGQRVKLREWQKDELRKIYNNPLGTRRAIISFGRKNGKTALAAFLLLLHLCGPFARPNSQLFSAAQSREQASVIFDLARKIVRMSPELHDFILVRDHARQLICKGLGTSYRALSAEVSTAFGLSPVFIVHDELGRVRGERSELYEALETATGAQTAPLSVIISTQAPTDSDLLSKLIDDAMEGHDPRTVISLYTAPLSDDPFALETISKANPALGDFLNKQEVLGMAADAQRMPARENEYRNLILNQRVEINSPFISRQIWSNCAAAPLPLAKHPVYGGLDLSESRDLTALILVARINSVWQVHSTFWLPSDGLREKSRLDRVPYDQWHKAGFLQTVPGKSINYEYIAERLKELFDEYDIRKIAFDRWNFKHLKPWLTKAGFNEDLITDKFVEFGQGFVSISPALRFLEGEILNAKLAHGNHPVLNMCFANAVIQKDPAGNRKLAKNKSPGRIDGAIALTMAMGVAPVDEEVKPREYQMLFI
jgi:phage terminase large subunit-like protein